MTVGRHARSIAEVVEDDLCVGCGLCEAVTGGRVRMTMTESGSLRPDRLDGFAPAEERTILTACPGVVARAGTTEPEAEVDQIWGAWRSMRYAWAADPDVRFRAATGGALTALAMHLLASGRVGSVLHVGADPDRPMRSRWVISEKPGDVLANTGSRYGPTSPLAGLEVALARAEPFAVVAKPCDLGALDRFATADDRVNRWCVARLALVCGGQSKLTKSLGVLDSAGFDEGEVTLFRYRGHGNPGPTRVEAGPHRAYETSYLSMWSDGASWDLEMRCKLCPDALGECADVAAADVWPGGAPTGEDDGFNGLIVRTARGAAIVESACADGRLVLGDEITPRRFDELQPHQVRKKHALAARFEGRTDVGASVIETIGLRLEELGTKLSDEAWQHERAGARSRAIDGGYGNKPKGNT